MAPIFNAEYYQSYLTLISMPTIISEILTPWNSIKNKLKTEKKRKLLLKSQPKMKWGIFPACFFLIIHYKLTVPIARTHNILKRK